MVVSVDRRPERTGDEDASGVRRIDRIEAIERRLRVAFVCDTFRAGVPSGGVIAARHLVEGLRRRHDVVVVSADADGPDCVRMPAFQIPIRAMRDQGFVMAWPRRDRLARLFATVDVVHLQFPFWLSFVAMDEAHRAGRPVVAGFHVQPENGFLSVGIDWPWLCRSVYRFWVSRLFNRAEVVLCPSEFAAHKLRAHGLRTPTVVVSNGVPLDAREHVVARPRLHDGEFVIMIVGRLAAEKRQELLIQAVQRSRHRERIRLVVAGQGPREKLLARLAAPLGPARARIGYLPREELLDELAGADLLVHCSDVELEGLAVLEAMSLGVPVLVADSPESAASRLVAGNEFRFPSGDVEALTSRIDALLDHPALLSRAGRDGMDLARSLDFGESVDRVAQLYRCAIERGCSPKRLTSP